MPGAPGGADLRVVVATVSPGQDLTVGVVDGTGTPVGADDPGLAIARVLVPLLLGIGTEAAQDLLDTPVGAGPGTVGEVLDGVILRRVGAGAGGPAGAPVPDLLDPDALFGRVIALAGNLRTAFAPTLAVGPLTVTGVASVAGTEVTVRLRLGVAAGETWWLVDAGDVRIGVEIATEWAGIAPADGGVEVSLTVDPTVPAPVRGVTIAIRGATVRVAGRAGEDLLDLGVRLRSVALSAVFVPTAPTLFGGRLALDRLAVPIGGAGGAGGNGVAAKVLDPDSTGGAAGDAAGDTEKPAPALSPELSLVSRAGAPVTVDLRMGDGDGPWWLPLQAHLGPVYIEQFGFGVTRSGGTVTRLRLLVDGGVSIAGLTAQVDDLELNLPWPAPWEVSQSRFSLAGLAVGYQGSGVSIAGALLKTAGATEKGSRLRTWAWSSSTPPASASTPSAAMACSPSRRGRDYVSLFFVVGATRADWWPTGVLRHRPRWRHGRQPSPRAAHDSSSSTSSRSSGARPEHHDAARHPMGALGRWAGCSPPSGARSGSPPACFTVLVVDGVALISVA